MLFVEGNHFCPSCEKSGNCELLQATAYQMGGGGRTSTSSSPTAGGRQHPDLLLDLNRCILCELCVRASREVDGRTSSPSPVAASPRAPGGEQRQGRLADTDFAPPIAPRASAQWA